MCDKHNRDYCTYKDADKTPPTQLSFGRKEIENLSSNVFHFILLFFFILSSLRDTFYNAADNTLKSWQHGYTSCRSWSLPCIVSL